MGWSAATGQPLDLVCDRPSPITSCAARVAKTTSATSAWTAGTADQPAAATVAHDLRIERGGSNMERFTYGWCPCGWQYDADPWIGFTDDRIKLAFAGHLRGLRRA